MKNFMPLPLFLPLSLLRSTLCTALHSTLCTALRSTLLCLLLSLSLMSNASAELTLTQLTAQLSTPQELRAHFAQERIMTGFSRTLKAEGTLLISRDHGILWRQNTPFAQNVVIDERGILVDTGSGLKALSSAQNPQLLSFAQMLKSLFAGDLSALEQYFTLALSGTAQSWQLTLTPSHEPINLIFHNIELQGSSYVEQVTLNDKAGDSTHIVFSEFDPTIKPLSATEAQLFAH